MLVTGGAGFIGRHVVSRLLADGHQVWVIDNLSNGHLGNLDEMAEHPGFMGCTVGDIKDRDGLAQLFKHGFQICYHLGASINVQDSIDDPQTTYDNDVAGTFHVLEACRANQVKLVFVSTCMVYDRAARETGITELDDVKPASPYAGAKLAAEQLVLSYYYAYGMPVVVLRPFNTYGPYQKTGGEGGVVSIFLHAKLSGQPLSIYGDGTQTRDLLYVEDCSDFIVRAGDSSAADGQIIHAGSGRDVSINELARMIAEEEEQIVHVAHIHPQSEIMKLACNAGKAEELLDWRPKFTLEAGLKETERWIRQKLERAGHGAESS